MPQGRRPKERMYQVRARSSRPCRFATGGAGGESAHPGTWLAPIEEGTRRRRAHAKAHRKDEQRTSKREYGRGDRDGSEQDGEGDRSEGRCDCWTRSTRFWNGMPGSSWPATFSMEESERCALGCAWPSLRFSP